VLKSTKGDSKDMYNVKHDLYLNKWFELSIYQRILKTKYSMVSRKMLASTTVFNIDNKKCRK